MSSFSVDRHSICTECRGNECNLDCRCDESLSWSVEEMESYIRLRKSVASKSEKKTSSSVKTPSVPGPSAPSVDVNDKIRCHFAVFSQDVDDRIASMSSSIMNRLDDFFVKFSEKFTNRSFSAEPGVSELMPPTGRSPPLRHSVSTHVNPMRFQSDAGGPMPQSSGSAHLNIGELNLGLGASQLRAPHPQASMEAPEPAQVAQSSRQLSDRLQASGDHLVFVQEPEDKDEDDQESVVDFPVNKTYNHLVNYIYEQYPDSRPHSDPLVPPHCDFESFFAIVDPQAVGRPRMRWYPWVQEITAKTRERAQQLARESKSVQKVILLRRCAFPVADDPDYAAPQWLNPDFARLTRNCTITKSRAGSISFSDMERLERTSRTVVGGFSQSYWLLLSLLSQLKQDGYKPSEPALFDKTIQSLSSSMALQTSLVSCMTDFLVAKYRESFLAHVSVPLSAPQKRELQVTSGSGDFLFDQELLEKTTGQVKEDSIISSNVSLSRLARSGFRGKRSSSDASASSRVESSYGKRSSSPACGNPYKRFRGGRGTTPSSSKKGFRK